MRERDMHCVYDTNVEVSASDQSASDPLDAASFAALRVAAR